MFALYQKHIDHKQKCPTDYSHVGNIESRIMPRTKLDINKIDNKPETYAIDDVSDDTCKQQCQGSQDAVVGSRCTPKKYTTSVPAINATIDNPQRPVEPWSSSIENATPVFCA